MARWERLPLRTSLAAASMLLAGTTKAGIFGSSGGGVLMPVAMLETSTTFGNSNLPPINGHGWAAAARCLATMQQRTNAWASLVCMESAGRQRREAFLEAALNLGAGQIATAISGFME